MQAHLDNPEYPDEKAEDFVEFFDADQSDEPWKDTYCSVCGRIAEKFNADIARYPVLHCPYRNKGIHHRICSALCMGLLMQAHAAEVERYHGKDAK